MQFDTLLAYLCFYGCRPIVLFLQVSRIYSFLAHNYFTQTLHLHRCNTVRGYWSKDASLH